MQKKYKRILSFIGLLIILCAVIGVLYLFYEKVLSDETEVVVVEELSANFKNGYLVKNNGNYNFTITNNGANDIYYEIIINNLRNYQDNVKYTMKSDEANLNILNSEIDIDTNVLAENISIPAGSTQSFTFYLINNENTSFDLVIRKITEDNEYFYATILKNNELKEPITKVGEEVATENEGLILDSDDDGATYYFRGSVENNYVEFADSLWRIVRINGDGSVKLVLNDDYGEVANYHSSAENYENYLNDNIASILNSYYETYLKSYDELIANTKFCIENVKTTSDEKSVYNGFTRLVTNKIPTFNCLGEKHSNKIGLLTADEVIYAGANFLNDNDKFYLYNSEIENNWWTSTLAEATKTDFKPFIVSNKGKMLYNVSGMLYRSLRPVISLERNIMVSGDGTKTNPYVLK